VRPGDRKSFPKNWKKVNSWKILASMEKANACPSVQKPVVGVSENNKLLISKNPKNTYSS
jgi:hypothetical protein